MQADLARLGRIAIVNRGEPAMRCIHAVRELANEHDVPLRTVALHTEPERAAMFVREADEAVRIGPGPGEPPPATSPYLDHAGLERALVASGVDTVWVGWGFVAEHADFADLCARIGVTFVGPSGDVMRSLGDKIGAKQLAERAGVPVATWSGGPVADVEAARHHGERIGYPLVVKAAAGGGGRGIRIVHDAADLPTAFERARDEAARSFGDPTLFMEPLVTGARHIEVQIVADGRGGVWAPGVRDCSVQRRNQKVLEESSSTALTAEQEEDIKASAAELARLADYSGAGTVEFLYQPETGEFAFLEVNTRLQVEHPVTELTTGIDLVKLQFHVAAGGRLEGEAPPTEGHAIEVRLNAEDAERGFTPSPGTIERLRLPSGPGLRVDTGVAEGDTIAPEYDSMIAKIIAFGRDREEAISRLRRALAQTSVLVRGGTTNRAFLLDLLHQPAVLDGSVDTAWLDRITSEGGYRFDAHGEVALVAAAVDAYDAASLVERDRFYASAARGRPQASTDASVTIDLRYAGSPYRLEVARTGPDRYLVAEDGVRVLADIEHLDRFERRLTVGGRRYRVASIAQGADTLVEVDGLPHRISQDDAGMVRAPGPSVVVAVTANVGDEVEAGASLAVLESMKMETVLSAPFAGRVVEVLATGNVQLDAGAPVVRLEPIGDPDAEVATGDRADLANLAADDATAPEPAERARTLLDALRRFVLGSTSPWTRCRAWSANSMAWTASTTVRIWSGGNWTSWPSSPTSARSRGTEGRGTPTTARSRTTRASTSMRSCGLWMPRWRGYPRASRTVSVARSPTTASARSTEHQSSRRRCTASTCRNSERRPRCPWCWRCCSASPIAVASPAPASPPMGWRSTTPTCRRTPRQHLTLPAGPSSARCWIG
jgi:acetyl/propionyl-CoA carboxylase alpha subunit